MNYTEYFFDIIKMVKDKKPNNKIKTIGLEKCYYNNGENNNLLYDGDTIEILDDKYFLGGYIDNGVYRRYMTYPTLCENSKNSTLVLSRVGEHLIDIQYQILDIFHSGIADSVVMLLPDMYDVFFKLEQNLSKKCEKCFDFDTGRNMIEMFSCSYDDVSDLHRLYTSPQTIKTALKCSIDKNIYSNFEITECSELINGYKHFLVWIEFNKDDGFHKDVEYSIVTDDLPKFDFEHNELSNNGIYIRNGNFLQKLKCKNNQYDYAMENELCNKTYDTIIFNRIVSKKDMNDNIFMMYNMCKYIKPKTKIVIIEDDMKKIINDIETYNEYVVDDDKFWYLNSLLFGPDIQSIPSKYKIFDFCNQFYTTNKSIHTLMIQEGLYSPIECNDDQELVFPFTEYNSYTIQKTYIRN